MTVSSLQEAARQEAERRWPEPLRAMIGEDVAKSARNAFMAGAAWAEQEAAAEREEMREVIRGLLEGAINELGIVKSWDDLYARARQLSSPEPGSTGQED